MRETSGDLLEEFAQRFLLVGVEVGRDFPDQVTTFAQVFHCATTTNTDLVAVDLMLSVLKLQQVAGQGVREVSRFESLHVASFEFVAFSTQDPGSGAGTSIVSAFAGTILSRLTILSFTLTRALTVALSCRTPFFHQFVKPLVALSLAIARLPVSARVLHFLRSFPHVLAKLVHLFLRKIPQLAGVYFA